MKTSSGYFGMFTLTAFLVSIVFFGMNIPAFFLAFLSGYFFGTSSPESKMNAEFAHLLAVQKPLSSMWKSEIKKVVEEE